MFKQGFFSPFRLLFSTNKFADIEKLIFLATLGAGFFLFTANYTFDNDGYLFTKYAEALVYGVQYLDVDVTRYDIAYPILLLLSGYPFHHSLIGIAIINTIMAILMPMLIYLTIRPFFSKTAYYIALASIVTLAPFYYIKWIRPDHAYLFFTVLSIYLLSLFINTKRPIFLFAMTFAVIVTSLMRPAGNIMFITYILIAFLYARGSLTKYIICIIVALCALSIYSYHRHQFFSQYGNLSSYNGRQTFYNLYVNSKEYGIRLSSDLGPGMKKITDSLYQAMLPRPSLSSFIRPEKNNSHKEFLKTYVYPFNTQEFINQVYDVPCWDYFYMLYLATANDSTFFKASWEILHRYPWYPVAYTARNMWHLLSDPGYAHSRYNVNPFGRTGIQDAFPFDGESSQMKYISLRTKNELQFDTFDHKPLIAKKIINHIKNIFCSYYLKITKIIFYLMMAAWLTASIDLLSRVLPSSKLKYLANLLLPQKIGTSIIIVTSFYLLQSMLIISVFVDPMLRFHNHLIPFKIMLAGIGSAIIIDLIYQMLRSCFPAMSFNQKNLSINQNNLALKQYKIVAISLILMIITLFVGWSEYILINT